jgi:hypothetical protein
MPVSKDFYLSYWKQLKRFITDEGLDWDFASFDPKGELIVRIGKPKFKMILSIMGGIVKNPLPFIAVSFYIHDSREAFILLRTKRERIEDEIGKGMEWESHPSRKHCSVRLKENIDVSDEKNWEASFEWFAENAQKLRDVCHHYLAESKTELDLKHITGFGLKK